jgi:hypothetical protein
MDMQPQESATKSSYAMSPFFAADQGGPMLLFRLQANAIKATLKWQMETMDFVKRRFDQDVKLVDDLIEAREPRAILTSFSDFLQTAVDEYSRETLKAVNLGTELVSDSTEEIRQEAQVIVDDVAIATAA